MLRIPNIRHDKGLVAKTVRYNNYIDNKVKIAKCSIDISIKMFVAPIEKMLKCQVMN